VLDAFTSTEEHEARYSGIEPHELKQNRYSNILPYKETAVSIEDSLSSQLGSYINANYLTNPNDGTPRELICTQGPIDSSITNFWRMVLSSNISMVVMVCNLIEGNRVKCASYFPTKINEKLDVGGSIEVQLIEQLDLNSFVKLRRLKVDNKAVASDPRIITHIHVI